MPSRNTIEIVVQGEDRASKVLNNVNKSLDTLGKVSLGVVVGGIGLATAAVAGFGAKALAEFTTFQKGMSEVFTLLPGITEESMSQLEGQAQRVAAQFGVLPNEVVPAMYQAISAGVPKDNVFDFLSIASKAAVGGVTTLETAVDGISSVVNAYGSEVLSAQQASDLLFTAVRLGKTDFSQLSASLFNVVPTAASLGVGLDQVSAALAVITAQGTPTSVATTQLRQLFVELSKEGTKLSDKFLEISGKSFAQFTKEGGNVSEALETIRRSVGDDAFRNMFGSVEALNAALGISGPNAESFASALNEMGDSAGATDKAFNTMSKTISFQSNRLQSKLTNLFINVGRQFEPFAAGVIEGVGDVVSAFDAFLSGDTDVFSDLDAWDENIRPLVSFLATIKPKFDDIKETIGKVITALLAGVPVFNVLSVAIGQIFGTEAQQGFNNFVAGIQSFVAEVMRVTEPIRTWISENVKLQDVLIVIAGAIASVVIPAIVGLVAGLATFLAPIAAIIGAVALLRTAWENDFLGIRTFITEKLLPALGDLAEWFLEVTLPQIINFIQTEVIPRIQEFIGHLTTIWEIVRPHLENLANWFLSEALPSIVNFIQTTVIPIIEDLVTGLLNLWNDVGPIIAQLADWFLNTALPDIVNFVENTVIPLIQNLIDKLSAIWKDAQPFLNDLKTGIQNIFNFIKDNVIQPIIDRINEFKDTIVNVLSQLGLIQTEAGKAQTALNNVANNPSIAVTNPGSFYGFANGMDFFPRAQNIRVHRGEAVLTAQENEARLNGENGSTTNTFQIIINAPMTQDQANSTTSNYVTALRNQGIDL